MSLNVHIAELLMLPSAYVCINSNTMGVELTRKLIPQKTLVMKRVKNKLFKIIQHAARLRKLQEKKKKFLLVWR